MNNNETKFYYFKTTNSRFIETHSWLTCRPFSTHDSEIRYKRCFVENLINDNSVYAMAHKLKNVYWK